MSPQDESGRRPRAASRSPPRLPAGPVLSPHTRVEWHNGPVGAGPPCPQHLRLAQPPSAHLTLTQSLRARPRGLPLPPLFQANMRAALPDCRSLVLVAPMFPRLPRPAPAAVRPVPVLGLRRRVELGLGGHCSWFRYERSSSTRPQRFRRKTTQPPWPPSGARQGVRRPRITSAASSHAACNSPRASNSTSANTSPRRPEPLRHFCRRMRWGHLSQMPTEQAAAQAAPHSGTCDFAASGACVVFPDCSSVAGMVRSTRAWSCPVSSAGASTSPTRERAMAHSCHSRSATASSAWIRPASYRSSSTRLRAPAHAVGVFGSVVGPSSLILVGGGGTCGRCHSSTPNDRALSRFDRASAPTRNPWAAGQMAP